MPTRSQRRSWRRRTSEVRHYRTEFSSSSSSRAARWQADNVMGAVGRDNIDKVALNRSNAAAVGERLTNADDLLVDHRDAMTIGDEDCRQRPFCGAGSRVAAGGANHRSETRPE